MNKSSHLSRVDTTFYQTMFIQKYMVFWKANQLCRVDKTALGKKIKNRPRFQR
jgi:hypothetical protein